MRQLQQQPCAMVHASCLHTLLHLLKEPWSLLEVTVAHGKACQEHAKASAFSGSASLDPTALLRLS